VEKSKAYSQNSSPFELKEATTFPFIIFFVISHRSYIQMPFCSMTLKLRVLKFPKLGLSTLWKVITSHADLWLRWGLKQNYSLHWKFFNDMWHATYTHVFQGDFWFLMVGSQIGSLIFNPSFGHKLCFKYSNESCNPILNIYGWRTFQWYNFFFNPMNSNP